MNLLLSSLLQNTIEVAILCPMAWLICQALRTRPAVQNVIWLLLLVKLVLPPLVAWPWAVNVSDSWDHRWDRVVIFESNQDMPKSIDAAERVTDLTDMSEGKLTSTRKLEFDQSYESSTPLPFGSTELSWILVSAWMLGVWMLGVLVAIAFVLMRIVRQLRVRTEASDASGWLIEMIQRLSERMKVKTVRAAMSNRVKSPVICCLGAPRLLWPAAQTSPALLENAEGVVAHELAHVARYDHIVVWIEMAICAVLWWHPLVWWLQRRLGESRELACDAMAVSAVHDRQEYANIVLQLSRAPNDHWVTSSVLGVGISSRKSLERRLTMIFDERVCGRVSPTGVCVLGLIALLSVPSWLQSDEPRIAETQTSESPLTPTPTEIPAQEQHPNPKEEPQVAPSELQPKENSKIESLLDDLKNSNADEWMGKENTEIYFALERYNECRELLKQLNNRFAAIQAEKGRDPTADSQLQEMQNSLTIPIRETVKLVNDYERQLRRVIDDAKQNGLSPFDASHDFRRSSTKILQGASSETQQATTQKEFRVSESRSKVEKNATSVSLDLERQLLVTDIDEAEATVEENKIKLEHAEKTLPAGTESTTEIKLLKLALRKSMIELLRAKLHLQLHKEMQNGATPLGKSITPLKN